MIMFLVATSGGDHGQFLWINRDAKIFFDATKAQEYLEKLKRDCGGNKLREDSYIMYSISVGDENLESPGCPCCGFTDGGGCYECT